MIKFTNQYYKPLIFTLNSIKRYQYLSKYMVDNSSSEIKVPVETKVKNVSKKENKNDNKKENKKEQQKKEKKNNETQEKTENEDQQPTTTGKIQVKVVKGARDFTPLQMTIRNKVFQKITAVFKNHGAVEIDTPVFELKETLTGKYGEDSKLIYDLVDQGGEMLSLRYDLTVPFARYMAINNIPSIKRYHIGKVYRRDQPAMNKGRFREFYQCDFDIAGANLGVMVPDAEVLKIVVEVLTELNIGPFLIKLNHRLLLDAMIELSDISSDKFKTVCSSVDKLDKETWETVQEELIKKGVTQEQCNKLHAFVIFKDSPWKLLKVLKEHEALNKNVKGSTALKEFEILFEYLDIFEVTSFVSFDLSLARGLDYYTGLIYEVILTGGDKIGSISGGGRYDELVGMFSGRQIPSVGVSFGVERIFHIIEENYRKDPLIRESDTEVLVASIGKNMVKERLRCVNELWKSGIKAETLYNDGNLKPAKQLDYALEHRIPFMIWIGEDEVKANKVKIKCMANKDELFCSRSEFIEIIRKFLKQPELLVIIPPEIKEESKGDSKKESAKGERGNKKEGKGEEKPKKEEKKEGKGKSEKKGKIETKKEETSDKNNK